MAPRLWSHRGDLLLLTNYREEPIHADDIVVFRFEDRVIKVHEK
jgi:signal peptidase